MDKGPLFSVIIVTFNSEKTIKDCLASILKYENSVEIIVVDNNSHDETCSIVRQFGSQVILVEAGSNLGFAKASNLGAKKSTGDYLIFLNPDAFLTKTRSLEYLQKLLDDNPEYGLLGPKLIYPDKTPQPRTRNLPTITRAFAEYILGIQGIYSFYEPKCQKLCEVESVIGACVIIKKDVFEKVEGFNEKYFLYYEDLDLCKRLSNLRYKIGFTPEVVVEHAEGKSGVNQKTNQLIKASAKIYFGLFNYYLLELIFFYNRLINKIRKVLHYPVHV